MFMNSHSTVSVQVHNYQRKVNTMSPISAEENGLFSGIVNIIQSQGSCLISGLSNSILIDLINVLLYCWKEIEHGNMEFNFFKCLCHHLVFFCNTPDSSE